MLSAQQVLDLTPIERRDAIYAQDPKLLDLLDQEGTATKNLQVADKIASVINSFISDYFAIKIAEDQARADGSVLKPDNFTAEMAKKIESFKPIAVESIRSALPAKEAILKSSSNVYELAGAVRLSAANKVTRKLSTTMGRLWERIADISPYAINPETEFNLKIRGIDLIAKNKLTGVIEYQQLKTQKNTLTGSQKGRSVSELELHDHPVFCACFDTNSSWTFNHAEIPRVAGSDFWSRIGVDYDLLLSRVRPLILDLEDEYVKILEGEV